MKTGYAIGRAVENTFLVRERDRRRWRDLAVVLGTIVPLGAALVGYSWIHLEVIETGYRIAQLEEQRSELQESERRARLEISRLLEPQRLERLAREAELTRPDLEQVLFVDPASVELPAGPAPGIAAASLTEQPEIDPSAAIGGRQP